MSRRPHIEWVHAPRQNPAERWRAQYERPDKTWLPTALGDSGEVYKKLCTLGPKPYPKDVATIIGNKSWSHISCGGCGEDVERAISVEPWYGSDAISLCKSCCKEIAALLEPRKGRDMVAL